MGSYAETCCVSGLPIDGGDPVRFLLLTRNPYHNLACNPPGFFDRWFPRTFPLKARYNDYGSVEHVESGPARDFWLEGFQHDLIERGWGDNTIHDVPVKKTMTFEELLEALVQGRIEVRRVDFFRNGVVPKVPKGVPTMKRVETLLTKAGFPLYKRTDGFAVDQVRYGVVRVRWVGWSEGYGKDAVRLSDASELLRKYGLFLTTREHQKPELIVRHKLGVPFRTKRLKKGLSVAQAMIREDVWQALLQLKTEDSWKGTIRSVENFRRIAREHIDLLLSSDPGLTPFQKLFLSNIPGRIGTAYHLKKLLLQEDCPENFTDVVGEFAHVQSVLFNCRYQWQPVSGGAQFGEYARHVEFHRAILEVAEKRAAEQAANAEK